MSVEQIWKDCICTCHEEDVTECVGVDHCTCVPCTCPTDADIEYCKLSAVREGTTLRYSIFLSGLQEDIDTIVAELADRSTT